MAPTLPPTQTVPVEESTLTTGEIVIIAVGAYVAVMIIALLIRQCLKAQGISLCPAWVTEQCCGSCCSAEGEPSCCAACLVSFAEMCDCSTPTKKSCMDSFCPSKQWCDETFCCCMNAQPGGEMCQDCQGPECNCGGCNCACACDIPDCSSINCLCFKLDLSGGGGGAR
ncbi:keratin-associated protein 9-4-like [Actinia tenebrosa]|uniref:Keratin-associated protein 9-4-like n=1 Tax=Actinia tenebrosa TaxID=6105 RepID=A0A6P8J0D2_ACTTE|nr:keratin-associated protein 9-4-like [Actinia tenebrosa]